MRSYNEQNRGKAFSCIITWRSWMKRAFAQVEPPGPRLLETCQQVDSKQGGLSLWPEKVALTHRLWIRHRTQNRRTCHRSCFERDLTLTVKAGPHVSTAFIRLSEGPNLTSITLGRSGCSPATLHSPPSAGISYRSSNPEEVATRTTSSDEKPTTRKAYVSCAMVNSTPFFPTMKHLPGV